MVCILTTSRDCWKRWRAAKVQQALVTLGCASWGAGPVEQELVDDQLAVGSQPP